VKDLYYNGGFIGVEQDSDNLVGIFNHESFLLKPLKFPAPYKYIPPLDAFSTGLVNAWSMERQLLSSYSGSYYNDSASDVVLWENQVSGAEDLTQFATDPLPSLGSSPASLVLDNTGDYLGQATGGWDSDFSSTCYIVMSVRANSTATSGAVIGEEEEYCFLRYSNTNENLVWTSWDGAAEDTVTSPANSIVDDTWHTVEIDSRSGIFVGIRIRIDEGTTTNNITAAWPPSGWSTVADGVMLGTTNYRNSATNFEIREIGMWNVYPSADDRTAIRAVFAGIL